MPLILLYKRYQHDFIVHNVQLQGIQNYFQMEACLGHVVNHSHVCHSQKWCNATVNYVAHWAPALSHTNVCRVTAKKPTLNHVFDVKKVLRLTRVFLLKEHSSTKHVR